MVLTNSEKREGFLKFLQDKGTTPLCPSCMKNDWNVPGDEALTLNVPIAQSNGGMTIPQPAVPVRIMICANCGFLRMHAVGIVNPAELKG